MGIKYSPDDAIMMDGELVILSSEGVQKNWEMIETMLLRLFKKDFCGQLFSTAHVYDELMKENLQCWIYLEGEKMNSIFFTSIMIYPMCKVLAIPFAIGAPGRINISKVATWVEKFASARGCKYVKSSGRTGWARMVTRDWITSADNFYEV